MTQPEHLSRGPSGGVRRLWVSFRFDDVGARVEIDGDGGAAGVRSALFAGGTVKQLVIDHLLKREPLRERGRLVHERDLFRACLLYTSPSPRDY